MNEQVQALRRFNRAVTRFVGVLDEHYLGRPRPLAASRLLYEIGVVGVDVRELRRRFGFDSGYVARLLRNLEKESLVLVSASPVDRRVRHATLTESGLSEVQRLNELSDQAADILLRGIDDALRTRPVDSMRTVAQILSAKQLTIESVSLEDPRVESVLSPYFAELEERLPDGFERSSGESPGTVSPPKGVCILASIDSECVGCGALIHRTGFAEIKRMWVAPEYRGVGIGKRILSELESKVEEAGFRVVRLDTNGALEEARHLYARAGYRSIPPYNENPYADFWFEKRLPASTLNQ